MTWDEWKAIGKIVGVCVLVGLGIYVFFFTKDGPESVADVILDVLDD